MKPEWPIDAQQAKVQRENEEFVEKYLTARAALNRKHDQSIRIREDRDLLLAAAKRIAFVHSDCRSDAMDSLKAAIAAAEEPAP